MRSTKNVIHFNKDNAKEIIKNKKGWIFFKIGFGNIFCFNNIRNIPQSKINSVLDANNCPFLFIAAKDKKSLKRHIFKGIEELLRASESEI